MKTITRILLALVLIPGSAGSKLCIAQVMAIGHISAEVIESVSASSQAATTLSFETSTAGTSQLAATSPTLNLGTMTVNSGNNGTFNVVLKSATLSNFQGKNGFTLDPILSNNATASVMQSNGSQNIQLNGTANLNANQSSGLYTGSYTVVFAYN